MITPDAEIDLHEANPSQLRWELLPFLDRGLTENWESVRIVHGVGEGVLKKEVWSFLDKLDYIEDYHLASIYEGGRGATVARYTREDVTVTETE
jgi:DNA mismatch repair protein MutS2